jgi:hypothetical protein
VLATPVARVVLAAEAEVAILIVLAAQETLHLQAQVKVVLVDRVTTSLLDAAVVVVVQVLLAQTQTVLMGALVAQERHHP